MEQITKENCSKAIDQICEEAGINKKQLADILGVAPSSITRIQKEGQQAGDDFINRMRTLQILGYAKYKDLLSSKQEIDPALLSGRVLTVSGVLTGLTAIASLKSIGAAAAVSIPLLGLGPVLAGGLLAGGIYKWLSVICKKNKLGLVETDDNIEIKSTSEKEN